MKEPAKAAKKRRVVIVEFDVTRMSQAEIDELLLCALRRKDLDVTFKIEVQS